MTAPQREELEAWLTGYIESWVPIQKSDPQYVREAKAQARREFVDGVLSRYAQTQKDTITRVLELINTELSGFEEGGEVQSVLNTIKASIYQKLTKELENI